MNTELNTKPIKKTKDGIDLALRMIIIITLAAALIAGYIALTLSENIYDSLTVASFVVFLGLFVWIFGNKYDK